VPPPLPAPAGPPPLPADFDAPVIPLAEEEPPPAVVPRPRRRPGRRQPDPAFCLNHETVASQHKCADCGEAFCADCVVIFQGKAVCGPCKNYRVRLLTRPARVSGLAVAAVILAILTGPLALCLYPLGGRSGPLVVGLLALLPQVVAFTLATLALRATEGEAQKSGRSLAITAMVTAAVAGVLTLSVAIFVHRPQG
jgi:hypothetical protein